MATSVDTLSTYEAIAAAGVEDRGARAISKAIADSASANRADLATKADLENLRISLTASIDTKIAEVGVKIADMGVKIADMGVKVADVGKSIEIAQKTTIQWVVGTGMALIVAIIGAAVASSKLL